MKTKRILLISKSNVAANNYLTLLRYNGYLIKDVYNIESVVAEMSNSKYNLVLIDGLEDISKTILCNLIRNYSLIPIIVVLSCYKEIEIVELLNSGADDCLVKPIHTYEFLARIKRLINRYDENNYNEIIEIGNLKYNRTSDTINIGNKEINLTQTETRLLRILIDNIGKTVSSKELLKKV